MHSSAEGRIITNQWYSSNGSSRICLLGVEARKVIKLADITTAVTLESVKGSKKAYDPSITSLKPHPGQIESVNNLNKILEDSEISQSHENCSKVQDPYSLRCVPQVHGAIRQTINHAEEVLNIELNSVTDNPLVFVDEKKLLVAETFMEKPRLIHGLPRYGCL